MAVANSLLASHAGAPTIAANGIIMLLLIIWGNNSFLLVTSPLIKLNLFLLHRCNNEVCLYIKLSNTVTL